MRNLAAGYPSHAGAWPGGGHAVTLACLKRRGWVADGTRYRGELFLTVEGERVLLEIDPGAKVRRPMDGVAPMLVRMYRACHSPHFMRELRAWGCMRRGADDSGGDWYWADAAGYCLDRTEAT